jgi:hypothetical protein
MDLLFDYYVNYSSPGTPVVTSGYRTPNRNPGVSTSLHLYGRATDANVPGWFDSSHHGDINDPSSQSPTVAYAIWDDLAQHALSNGADNVESWSTMYQQGGNSNSALNHVHASYGYTQ